MNLSLTKRGTSNECLQAEAAALLSPVSKQAAHSNQSRSIREKMQILRADNAQYQHENEQLEQLVVGLFESVPGAILVLNPHQQVIKVNACACQWFSRSLVGEFWSDVKAEELVSTGKMHNQFLLQGKRSISLASINLHDGLGCVIILTSNTEHQSNHSKKLAEMGEFAASLAHQVRTPLSSALLYASQLMDDNASAENSSAYSHLLDQLERLSAQVSNMLSYAHTGALIKSPVEIGVFVEELASLCLEKSVLLDIDQDVSFSSTMLNINSISLIGAIGNLLNNSMESMGGKTGAICAVGLRGKDILTITVSDMGKGILKDDLIRIFTPFYTRKANGTGLGLTVVQQIAEAHDGSVKCESVGGVGATFTLTLPVVIAAPINVKSLGV